MYNLKQEDVAILSTREVFLPLIYMAISNNEFRKIMSLIRSGELSTDPALVKDRILRLNREEHQERLKRFKWYCNPLNIIKIIKLVMGKFSSCIDSPVYKFCAYMKQRRVQKMQVMITDILNSTRSYRSYDGETREIIEMLGLCCESRNTGNTDSILCGDPTIPFYMQPNYSRKVNGKFQNYSRKVDEKFPESARDSACGDDSEAYVATEK